MIQLWIVNCHRHSPLPGSAKGFRVFDKLLLHAVHMYDLHRTLVHYIAYTPNVFKSYVICGMHVSFTWFVLFCTHAHMAGAYVWHTQVCRTCTGRTHKLPNAHAQCKNAR
jgi:hypothetical protein